MVALPFAWGLCRSLRARRPELFVGLAWFVIPLAPVLVLRNLTMPHNLYVPVIGVALLFGAWLERIGAGAGASGRLRQRAAVAGFVAVVMAASLHHNLRAVAHSWIAEASQIAERSLAELKEQRPRLPIGASLYIINGTSRDLAWFYDYGSLFRLFYGDPTLRATFAPPSDPSLGEFADTQKTVILHYDGRSLVDVTDRHRRAPVERGSL
jgi:hypothetical protein